MIGNRSGEMGFMEAVLSMMAVVLALTAFLGAAALLISADSEEDLRFNVGMLGGEIINGEFVPSYECYLQEYLDASGKTYVSVEADVPGEFCEDSSVSLGTDPGSGYSTLFRTMSIGCDGGRKVPAIFRVTIC